MNADDVVALERQHVGRGSHLGHREQYNEANGVKSARFCSIYRGHSVGLKVKKL